MQFIKLDLLRFVKYFALALCLVLSACSSMGPKDKLEKDKDAAQTAEGEAPLEGEPAPFVLIPNPYTPGDAPAQAKQEYARIKELMLAKKWKQAKGELELMVGTYPKLSGPYANLGIVNHKLGELDEAEKALKFAIETNPQNFDAYTRLALLYREQGRFADAEGVLKSALTIWPHHLPSTINLGILYDLYMGRFDEALVYYELSQNIVDGKDRKLKGWIVDLKRRMESEQ